MRVRAEKGPYWGGTSLLVDAIQKEVENFGVAFTLLPLGGKSPPGQTKSSGRLVFDVKMDFTHKESWVKYGHCLTDPTTSSFYGVVSRESIRTSMTYASIMVIEIMEADIMNE